MSRACTPVLVGVVFLISEIWLPFKNGQISLSGHGYSPWSWKNSIDRNRLKNFMQVGVDVTSFILLLHFSLLTFLLCNFTLLPVVLSLMHVQY